MQALVRGPTLTGALTLGLGLSLLSLPGAAAAAAAAAACRPVLSVFAPKRLEALRGSCLRIPCAFSAKRELETGGRFCGFWFKTDTRLSNLVHQTCETYPRSHGYPMRIDGDLSGNVCDTQFSGLITNYTDVYRFRLVNLYRDKDEVVFKANAGCDPVEITVNDSPPSPTVDVAGELKEKENVTVTCWAATPCPPLPPHLTWSLKGGESSTEERADRTLTTKIQKNITLSDADDGVNITCSAAYPLSGGKEARTAATNRTLSVSYAPKNTLASVSPEGPVPAGSLVNLSCSSRARPPVSRFAWFRRGADGPVNVSQGDLFSLNVTDGGVYYCVATNKLGNQTSSEIQLVLRDQSSGFARSGLIAAGVIGIVAALGLLVSNVLVFSRWYKSKGQTPQEAQSQAGEARDKEEIHYGEISFTPKPIASNGSAPVSGREETVYSEVHLSPPASGSHQPAEDLYAQVKKN